MEIGFAKLRDLEGKESYPTWFISPYRVLTYTWHENGITYSGSRPFIVHSCVVHVRAEDGHSIDCYNLPNILSWRWKNTPLVSMPCNEEGRKNVKYYRSEAESPPCWYEIIIIWTTAGRRKLSDVGEAKFPFTLLSLFCPRDDRGYQHWGGEDQRGPQTI